MPLKHPERLAELGRIIAGRQPSPFALKHGIDGPHVAAEGPPLGIGQGVKLSDKTAHPVGVTARQVRAHK